MCMVRGGLAGGSGAAPPPGGSRIRNQRGGGSARGYDRLFAVVFGGGFDFTFGSGTPTAVASTSLASGSQPSSANAWRSQSSGLPAAGIQTSRRRLSG